MASKRFLRLTGPALRQAAVDSERFVLVYDEYGERILRFFSRRVLDAEVAFDLHAELFASAFEQRRRFRGSTREEEEAWLYAIARHLLARYWRRGAVERAAMRRLGLPRTELSDASIERVEELAELESLRPAISAALGELPEDQRRAVTLRIVDEQSYEEISVALGVSQDLARQRVSRGLRALGKLLALNQESGMVRNA